MGDFQIFNLNIQSVENVEFRCYILNYRTMVIYEETVFQT